MTNSYNTQYAKELGFLILKGLFMLTIALIYPLLVFPVYVLMEMITQKISPAETLDLTTSETDETKEELHSASDVNEAIGNIQEQDSPKVKRTRRTTKPGEKKEIAKAKSESPKKRTRRIN